MCHGIQKDRKSSDSDADATIGETKKRKIEQKLLEVSEYETLSVDYEIDKSLLGGIVIRIGNQVLDNSIRAKLDAMTRDLSKVRLSN